MPLCLTLHVLYSVSVPQPVFPGRIHKPTSQPIKATLFLLKGGFPPLQRNQQNVVCITQQAASAEILKNTLSFVIDHPSSMENFGSTKNLRNT